MAAREALQFGHARHLAVALHDLADDGCRLHAGQPAEVDARLRLAGPHEHAPLAGP